MSGSAKVALAADGLLDCTFLIRCFLYDICLSRIWAYHFGSRYFLKGEVNGHGNFARLSHRFFCHLTIDRKIDMKIERKIVRKMYRKIDRTIDRKIHRTNIDRHFQLALKPFTFKFEKKSEIHSCSASELKLCSHISSTDR